MAGSIDDVTDFLVKKATGGDAPEAETPPAKPAVEAEEPEQEIADEPTLGEEEELPEEEEEGGDEEEEQDDEAEAEDDEPDTLDISDDDLIEVKVDGESKTITLGELRAAYTGEGAIQKRLEEATMSRKAAAAERDTAIADSGKAHRALLGVVQQLESMLIQPTVAAPDDSLKQTNPGEYLRRLDRYNAEQQNVTASRDKLVEVFKQQSAVVKDLIATAKKEQVKLLHETFAPFQDEKTKETAAKDIMSAIEHYEFSPADLEQVVDHRIYKMAYDAMQYHKLKSRGKTQLGELKEKVSRKPRTLRSATARKSRVTESAKKATALKKKAAASGNVDDVAALLVHNRKAKSRR